MYCTVYEWIPPWCNCIPTYSSFTCRYQGQCACSLDIHTVMYLRSSVILYMEQTSPTVMYCKLHVESMATMIVERHEENVCRIFSIVIGNTVPLTKVLHSSILGLLLWQSTNVGSELGLSFSTLIIVAFPQAEIWLVKSNHIYNCL